MHWALLVMAVCLLRSSRAPPVTPSVPEIDLSKFLDKDESYRHYIQEVLSVLEEDPVYRQKLMTASIDDIVTGKLADDFHLIEHNIRTRLDEVKRLEVSRQRELVRLYADQVHGIKEREHWVDLDNQHIFSEQDFRKLLKKEATTIQSLDEKRHEEYVKHEMEKERLHQEHLKSLSEEQRKLEEEKEKNETEEQLKNAKLHEPGSKAQYEEVWEEEDGYEASDFNPKTFFMMHDINGDGYWDISEVEAVLMIEVSKLYNESDKDFDSVERDEELMEMRQHVFKEYDKDGDMLVSLDEFQKVSSQESFKEDEGWKSNLEQPEYSEEEYKKYMSEYEVNHAANATAPIH